MKTKLRSIVTVFMISVLLFGCSNKQSKVVEVPVTDLECTLDQTDRNILSKRYKFENVDSNKYNLRFEHYSNGELVEELDFSDKLEGLEFDIIASRPSVYNDDTEMPLNMTYKFSYDGKTDVTLSKEYSFPNTSNLSVGMEGEKIIDESSNRLELFKYIIGDDFNTVNTLTDFSKQVYTGDVLLILLVPTK